MAWIAEYLMRLIAVRRPLAEISSASVLPYPYSCLAAVGSIAEYIMRLIAVWRSLAEKGWLRYRSLMQIAG